MRGVRRLPAGFWLVVSLFVVLWGSTVSSYAIEVQPTTEQIQAQVERGKLAAGQGVSPDQLHAWFGATEDLALRALSPTEQDIAQVLANEHVLVNVVLYGDRVNFAADSYIVLEQAGRTVKPSTVRFDARGDRTTAWPQQPAYRAKVIAQFAYAELDPRAKTTLTVFPSRGGQVSFELDFSRIE